MTDTTYKALQAAAERIGFSNYQSQLAAHKKAGRKASTFVFHVTPEHQAVVEMMGRHDATDDVAMSLLWEHNTMRQRLAAAQ